MDTQNAINDLDRQFERITYSKKITDALTLQEQVIQYNTEAIERMKPIEQKVQKISSNDPKIITLRDKIVGLISMNRRHSMEVPGLIYSDDALARHKKNTEELINGAKLLFISRTGNIKRTETNDT